MYHAAPASTAEPRFRYRVERASDGWIGLAPERAPFGPTSLEDVFAFLEWRATEDLLASSDAVFLHAAGVQVGAMAVLLVGASGSGKSALAAHLFMRGHRLWGDDLVRFATLERSFSAAPRSLKLDANALESLNLISILCSESARGTLLALQTAYVSPAAFRRSWQAPDGPADVVVLLDRRSHNGPARIERISEGEAALVAARMLMGGGTSGNEQEHAELMARVLESMMDMRAYRAAGSPPAGLADALERELAA